MDKLTELLKEKFGCDKPVFASEILGLFPQYTKAYVFRLVTKAEDEGNLVRFCQGVYYVPQMTQSGPSQIAPSDVIEKRYVKSGDEVYGIYSGVTLQNLFSATDETADAVEVVSNRTSSKYREITLNGCRYILRKSRFEITAENEGTYRVLQYFTENSGLDVAAGTKKRIKEYIKEKGITRTALLDLGWYFPAITFRNLSDFGLL